MLKIIAIILIPLVIIAAIVGPQLFFVVDETQMAVVTRFGDPRSSILNPGLYVKTPFVETVTYFDKRLLIFDAPPDSLLTEDKRNLVINVYARGRIVDPLLFFETVRTEGQAANRAVGIISSELRKEIAQDEQSEIIRTSREEIMTRIRDASAPQIRQFGLELIDVRIKRADFPPSISESVFGRMQAERQRIADRERAEGAERDAEIRAEVDRLATVIRAEAERDANIVRGEGEAEAISIFAESLEQGPEFYEFQRSLEAYKNFLNQNTTVVLPASSDLFQFLQNPRGISGITDVVPANVSTTMRDLMKVEAAARGLIESEMDVNATEPTLTKIERVQWSDASLGCPVSGVSYAPTLMAGFSLTFDHNGDSYEIHTNADGSQLVSCTS